MGFKTSGRLAARARLLYLVIPAITIVILLGIGALVSGNIADDAARRLSRQYAIEASANFRANMDTHMILMQQIARSTTISRWMANEDDSEAKAMAFNEIMGYAIYAPEIYLMLTIYESLQGWDFETDLTFEEFAPWGILAGGDVSAWFFNTRDAEKPFIINIQRTRPVDGDFELYIWSNHRVYYDGEFVGVVTVGSHFDKVFESVFGDFDVYYRRGYIIDRYGATRLDSAMTLYVLADGLPTFPEVPEALENPVLANAIELHMHMLVDGAFPIDAEVHDTLRLEYGNYTYASIAPIVGTDWSVVVLSSAPTVFDIRYMPMIYGGIAVLILSTLLGGLLVRRMILAPLLRLTQTAVASGQNGSKLYGLAREDEIGDLARNIDRAQETIKQREKLLKAVNRAAKVLLTANEDNTLDTLMEGMELIGTCLEVDRIQIWRNEEIDGELHFVMKYEWASEIGAQKVDINIGTKSAYSSRPGWLEMFKRGESINAPVSQLPPEDARFLGYHSIKSVVILPMFFDRDLFGFFRIDDYQHERTFSDDEMDITASAALMFTSVFNRNLQRELARTDALTSTRNRRYLVEGTEAQFAHSQQENTDFSVIMYDIDHFKNINDTYGHIVGDEVLKILAARSAKALKQGTELIRYGGEEFLVALPNVRYEDALNIAWRLQKTLESTPFTIGDLEIPVTASFGVAYKTAETATLTDLINLVDRAMYQAKIVGRNTVVGQDDM
ncbi:MAG: GGDEF domain-containing protein [Clostridiales bacterium]|jgi:diguanylate cyclase (GGDEF)-like protein|nr:GGDEF domain-containing protein [Clostridiales bacterium]